MNTAISHPLPDKTFKALIKRTGQHCVSIYLPMDTGGKEQNEHLAQAKLKSSIKEIHKELSKHHLKDDEIKEYLQPLEKLLANIELWRNPSQGLAIFLDQKGLQYYMLPIRFETKTQVAANFYIKSLLPIYYEDGDYYLLELSQDYVKLYKASRFSFTNMFVEDLAPETLEKAVGTDYKQKMLQFRSGQNIAGVANFHGHGEGRDDKEKELRLFLRNIDSSVVKKIKDTNIPLVLACTEEFYSLYKSISKYPNIYDKYIRGDSEFKNKNLLHEESWNLIKEFYNKPIKEKKERIKELYNTPKTNYEIAEIIPAALDGKIETLFVREDLDLFGIYDQTNGYLRLDPQKTLTNISLSDLVSRQTYLKGGNVYLSKVDEMPIQESALNALFRF